MENFELESVLMDAKGTWSNDNPYNYGISFDGKFDINYSSILTFLIQTAGRICKHYASDLFITWSSLEEKLKNNPEYKGEKFLFGFREMGVDHNAFVLSRLNNYGKERMEKEIKELYMVEINTEEHYGIFGNLEYIDITMKLGKAKLTEN